MKFVTNKITMNPGTFDDFVQKVLSGGETVKTASVEEVVKTAEQDEAESSGQPEAEAKLVNDPKKEGGKSGKADNSEAESSGQPEAEAKLVNDPKKKCDKEAAGEPFGGKQAPPFGSEDKDDKKDDDKKDDDEKCEKCDCSPCECDKKEEDKEASDKTKAKEASTSKVAFIRIGAMNAPTKAMLRTYWLTMYPSDYVDAMLAEK